VWSNISLGESQTKDFGYVAQYDKKDLIGQEGITKTPLRPSGIALINDKRIDVVTKGEYIDKEKYVEVIEVSGNRIVVRKIQSN
jgi:membrane-bound serine protease (ClpP class)